MGIIVRIKRNYSLISGSNHRMQPTNLFFFFFLGKKKKNPGRSVSNILDSSISNFLGYVCSSYLIFLGWFGPMFYCSSLHLFPTVFKENQRRVTTGLKVHTWA